MNYPLLLLSYGLRGLGYPLFAYGFLVWIAAATPQNRLGSAVGWFWFAFTGGLPTLGSLLASLTIPADRRVQHAVDRSGPGRRRRPASRFIAVRERTGYTRLAPPGQKPLATLASSLTILWRSRRSPWARPSGRSTPPRSSASWSSCRPSSPRRSASSSASGCRSLTVMFLTNIFFNLLFGIIGDKLGWRQTVTFFGGIGCGLTTLAFYYVPLAVGPNLLVAMLVGAAYGATLAAFVPLSALMPSLAPETQGRGDVRAELRCR